MMSGRARDPRLIPVEVHDMADTSVTVRDNGPYLIKGPIDITDADGNQFTVERETVALCRCGGSTNKPFCDGTHSKIGFQAAERAVKAADGQSS